MNMSLSKLQEVVKDREAWHAVVQGIAKSRQMTEQMNNNHSMLGSSVLHYLPEFAQIHVHWFSDAT